jgi:hypothetical protein
MISQKWQAPYEGLSKRAVEILHLLAEGMSDCEVAERRVMTQPIDIKKKNLGISDSNTQGLTVAAHEGKHLVWGVGKVS